MAILACRDATWCRLKVTSRAAGRGGSGANDREANGAPCPRLLAGGAVAGLASDAPPDEPSRLPSPLATAA